MTRESKLKIMIGYLLLLKCIEVEGKDVHCLHYSSAVDFMAIMIINSPSIRGTEYGGFEYKLMKYSNDATLCVNDLNPINNIMKALDLFRKCAGHNLNKAKINGIWPGLL